MNAAEILAAAYRDGLRPDPILAVSEWADRYRILDPKSSSEPGLWRTDRTPYLRAIMDALGPQSDAQEVVFMKGAQIGGTEAGNNFLGYIIDHTPGPTLLVLPTVETAKRASKQRLAPMIQASPRLRGKVRDPRSRDSGNTIQSKEFAGGILIVTGANSSPGLRSMPVRFLMLDEIDAFPDDVDGEGDPIRLAERRTATYGRKRRVFKLSTPTVRGASKIEAAFARSDQRLYHVPCPFCGVFEPIRWRAIRWRDSDPTTAVLVCEHCEREIDEAHKPTMLSRGEWIATAQGEPGVVGFHLSALYSPLGWYSWRQAVSDFLEAKERPELLKTWTNTVLGETWQERGVDVAHDSLAALAETYAADVPARAVVLTAGVDVQDDRLEVVVCGWAPGDELFAVDSRVLWGSYDEPAVWDQLGEFLATTYAHESGASLPIAAAAVDTGFATDHVYRFVRSHPERRLYAVKGASGFGRPIVAAPQRRKTGKTRTPVDVFVVGVDEVKSLLFSRFRAALRGDSRPLVHFPARPEFDEEFYRQLTAERLEERYVRGFPRRQWTKTYARNEALDCTVYAFAALSILRPVYDVLARRLTEPKQEEPTRPLVRPPAPPTRRRRGGFVRRY